MVNAWLLLASVPDGQQRINVPTSSGVKQRLRCALDKCHSFWLLHSLEQHFPEPSLRPAFHVDATHGQKRSFHKQVVQLEGLVQVQPGDPVSRHAAESAETQLLRSYYHQPLDAATLPVLQSWHFVDSVGAPHTLAVGLAQSGDEVVQLKASKFVCNPYFVDAERILHLSCCSAGHEQCRSLQQVAGNCPQALLVLPAPVAAEAVRGTFTNLLWLGRWEVKAEHRPGLHVSLFPNWPPPEMKQEAGRHLAAPVTHLSAPSLTALAHDVRDWTAQIHKVTKLPHVNQEMIEQLADLIPVMETRLSQIEHWSALLRNPRALSQCTLAESGPQGQSQIQYSASVLLRALSVAFASRDGQTYVDTVKAA